MVDWLIIGGGIHGCVIAHALLRYGGVERARIAIVDPSGEPLSAWRSRTSACGMEFLRSPAAHALVPDFTALLGWARLHGYSRNDHTIPPYARPSLELFNAHAAATIRATGIRDRFVRGRVTAVERLPDGFRVAHDGGEPIPARRVVLAVGREALRVPEWAHSSEGVAHHVFARRFDRGAFCAATRPVIVGGGVTAAHLALTAVAGRAEDVPPVTLVSRHRLRVHQFDSDPCYIGPGCMEGFLKSRDAEQRRRIIKEARNPGSITPELAAALERAQSRGTLRIVEGEVQAVDRTGNDASPVELRLDRRGTAVLHTDAIALATGFEPGVPGGGVVRSLAGALATDGNGFPVPDASLQWDRGLFVTGALAEQELGPSAPNIVGAHNAAKRIIAHVHGRPRQVPAAWPRYAPASVSSSSASF